MLAKSFNNYGKSFYRFLSISNQRFRKEDSYSSSSSNKSEFFILGGMIIGGLYLIKKEKKSHSWIYRDDIGAPHGIHGYEEQVNSVGQHHGHNHWTNEGFLKTFDSASVRRGFKVWLKNCQSCHGAYKQKYDIMVEKIFSQRELIVSSYLNRIKCLILLQFIQVIK